MADVPDDIGKFDTDDDLKLYTVKEAAALFSHSDYTMRMWLKEGKIKGVKINGGWRIRRSDIIALINSSSEEY